MKEVQFVPSSAPDGGWGWIVSAAACIISFLIIGLAKASGVILMATVDEFKVTRTEASWVMAIAFTVTNILGVFVGSVMERVTVRKLVFTGGFIASLGYFFSTWAASIMHLYLSAGLIRGVGQSLCQVPTMVIVSQYFTKHISLANGIMMAGNSLGAIFFPPILEFFLYTYGFSGTMLLLSGLSLNVCVCALLFRPLKTKQNAPKNIPQEMKEMTNQSELQLKAPTKNAQSPRDNCDAEAPFLQNGSLESRPKSGFIKTDILKDVHFILISFSMFCIISSFGAVIVMLADHVRSKYSVSTKDAVFLLSIYGIGDMAGRIILGWLYDKQYIQYKNSFVLAQTLSGLSLLASNYADTYEEMMVASVVFGFFMSSCPILTMVLFKQFLGMTKFPHAAGYCGLLIAISSFSVPPLIGALRDSTNSYYSGFVFAGCSMLTGAFTWLLEYPLLKFTGQPLGTKY